MSITDDACAIISLFVATALIVAAFIDEHALHGLFIPAQGTAGVSCVMHWLLGICILCALNRVADLEIAMDTKALEIAFMFVSLTYLGAVFIFKVAACQKLRGQHADLGLVLGAAAPAIIFIILVACVTVSLNASFLPLVLTTDAAVVLSMPLLNVLVLGRLQGPALSSDRSALATDGPYERRFITAPRLVYFVCFGFSWTKAPAEELGLLLTQVPPSLLATAKNLMFMPDDTAGSALDVLLNATGTVLDAELHFSVRSALAPFLAFLLAFAGLIFCWIGPAKARTSEGSAAAARRRLTKLRANSKMFPAPFPNGWYHLCNAGEVPVGSAIPASACNKEFVVFRGAAGEVGVLHAFCPHLGTHLGHGGTVKGNGVVCPYHSWTFDSTGKCIEIPYCPKEPTERTNTKAFPCRERVGMIFVWLHADGEGPQYEMTIFDEIATRNMRHVIDVPVRNWDMHIMEPSQNAADPYHFNTVHQWLGAKDMHGTGGWLWVRHECKSRLALLGHKEPDGSLVPDNMIHIDEKCVEMWLFGLIPVPSFINAHYSSGATFQGPQLSVFRIDTLFFGSCRVVFTFTPEAPFQQRTSVKVFCTPGFPGFLASFLGRTAVATVEQDRQVWENKLAVAPRNVVSGDGPFAAYGTWLRQFYSPSSQTWGDDTLEW